MAEGNHPYNVPVRLSKTNVLTSEFDNMWDNFGKEMKAMQEEMNRFQEAMFSRAFTSPHGFTTPLIQDAGNGRQELKLRFDVSQYTPEEIEVRTENNHLLVHAKHEENDGTKRVYREYNQQFMLPQGISPDSVQSNLSADGVLTVQAPIPQLPDAQKHLAIRR
ncbi:protein lethal(2)essential for life-like [Coccinella septempunctata]|uniref:protein lethal(2)essential for life-like n=1 Tax=Coccinella septempunctata TaxID=41139 RepID=UPI001D091871|nr:protein lethal(2)essential for life-like [Coccinella septempunctata]